MTDGSQERHFLFLFFSTSTFQLQNSFLLFSFTFSPVQEVAGKLFALHELYSATFDMLQCSCLSFELVQYDINEFEQRQNKIKEELEKTKNKSITDK